MHTRSKDFFDPGSRFKCFCLTCPALVFSLADINHPLSFAFLLQSLVDICPFLTKIGHLLFVVFSTFCIFSICYIFVFVICCFSTSCIFPFATFLYLLFAEKSLVNICQFLSVTGRYSVNTGEGTLGLKVRFAHFAFL